MSHPAAWYRFTYFPPGVGLTLGERVIFPSLPCYAMSESWRQ